MATVGYSALGLLGLGSLFGAISYYLHRNSKKKGNSFALDLQAIVSVALQLVFYINNNISLFNPQKHAAEGRTKTPGITYARFHDEHMMQGDNINYTTSS